MQLEENDFYKADSCRVLLVKICWRRRVKSLKQEGSLGGAGGKGEEIKFILILISKCSKEIRSEFFFHKIAVSMLLAVNNNHELSASCCFRQLSLRHFFHVSYTPLIHSICVNMEQLLMLVVSFAFYFSTMELCHYFLSFSFSVSLLENLSS